MAVKIEATKDEIVIRVPNTPSARKAAVESKSGKTLVLGTTSGFTRLSTEHGEASVSLNVTIPKG